MKAQTKGEWPLRHVFRIIKSDDGITPITQIVGHTGLAKVTVNRKLAELVERGLITRSIDANPYKRKMKNGVRLTSLGYKTKPEDVLPKPRKLSELMVGYWRYMRRYQATSINNTLALISKPEIPPAKAARELTPWVVWLASSGYIAVQGGSEEVKLWDRVYYLAKDNGPNAPDWIEE